MTTQHTLGKWDENAGKLHTFRRWEMHGDRRNRRQGALEAVTTPHTLGKWDENAGKLRTFGRWEKG